MGHAQAIIRRCIRSLPATLWVCALACTGCESTALSLDNPSEYQAVLEPDYLEGTAAAEIVLVFDGVADVDDNTGDSSGWQVSIIEFGAPGLYLAGYRFLSNFKVQLTVALEDPDGASRPIGQHDLILQISNHYGTFTATTSLLVFP
ncbi:MAG: hypothetical protein ACI9U2_002771 [Bradymonadia bacterium]|jgi:hypothetical protein